MKQVKTLIMAIWLSAMSLGVSTHGVAEEMSNFSDIQHIVDAGVLRVAILGKDAAPMIMTDRDGDLLGTEPDLARDLAQKLGVHVEFVRSADTYDGVVDVIAQKKADIAVSYLTGGVERALHVGFSRPYIKQNGRLFYNRSKFADLRRRYDVEDLASLRDLPFTSELVVGVVGGSIYKTILNRDAPGLAVKAFNNLSEIMEAVRAGEIFAGMHGSLQVNFYLRTYPAMAIHVALEPNVRLTSDVRIAVRPDAPNLLRWIDLYIANYVGMLDHDTIIAQYLGKTPIQPPQEKDEDPQNLAQRAGAGEKGDVFN